MFILKRTHKRKIEELGEKLKQEFQKLSEEQISRIQTTCARQIDDQMKRRTELEAKIIDAQEKNQQFFYKKEKDLKEQLQLGIIDQKEYYYSQRLLEEIEKALK